jgi:hypothetical protein
MDLSEYVKNTGHQIQNGLGGTYDEKIIEKEVIERLLDAKCGKAGIYAVVTSIYEEESDIGGGFFATAYNTEHLLSKNYAPAEEEFKKVYDNLKKEHFLFAEQKLNISRIKENEFSNIGHAKFRLNWGGSLEFLEIGFEKGIKAISLGDKINVSLNHVYLNLSNIEYSDKHKALCYAYEYYTTSYMPIVLD